MPPKTKKISLKKATKVETSEQANAQLRGRANRRVANVSIVAKLLVDRRGRCQGERLPAYWRELLAELLDAIVTTVCDVDVVRGV